MNFEIELIKNTENCCVKCNTFNCAYIYCPVFEKIQYNSKQFDATGELDGCNLFSHKVIPEKE